MIVTAGFDPLRSEGDAYAAALKNADVTVVHRCEGELTHSFTVMGAVSKAAQEATERIARRRCAAGQRLMPEGDTLFNTALTLRPALLGESLTAVNIRARGMYRLRVGDTVRSVEAVGKFLEIVVSGALPSAPICT